MRSAEIDTKPNLISRILMIKNPSRSVWAKSRSTVRHTCRDANSAVNPSSSLRRLYSLCIYFPLLLFDHASHRSWRIVMVRKSIELVGCSIGHHVPATLLTNQIVCTTLCWALLAAFFCRLRHYNPLKKWRGGNSWSWILNIDLSSIWLKSRCCAFIPNITAHF